MNRSVFKGIQVVDVRGTGVAMKELAEERVRQSLLLILESNVLCSIGTVTPEGRPHINTAYFSYSDGLELYFLSHPDSLHCQNLRNNSSMAMTVFSSMQQWTDPGQGVQLFGTCQETSGSSAEEAEWSYERRFQAYQKWKATLRNDDLARQYRFYRFDVGTVKILDEKNLGDAVWVRATVVRR